MAIQGKGILDGFSGKVGNVVGYHRLGKSIVQQKKLGGINNGNLIFDIPNVIPVSLSDVEVGPYYIEADKFYPSNDGFAYLPFKSESNVWEVQYTNGNGIDQFNLYVMNATGNTGGTLTQVRIRLRNNSWDLILGNQIIENFGIVYLGQEFRLVSNNKEFKLYSRYQVKEWTLYRTFEWTFNGGVQFLFGMRGNGSRAENIKLGGNKLVPFEFN